MSTADLEIPLRGARLLHIEAAQLVQINLRWFLILCSPSSSPICRGVCTVKRRAAQSESKAFYGVRRTFFDFEIEQFGNVVSGRGRDQKSVRHAGLVTLAKISMVLKRYKKTCCLSHAVIRS